jgi:hypothetical protein
LRYLEGSFGQLVFLFSDREEPHEPSRGR